MKRLFLLRHGQAQAYASTDAQRNLTDHGRLEINSTIEQVLETLPLLDEVWVSPYCRAQQTWEQASSVMTGQSLKVPSVVVSQPAITPAGDIGAIMALLEISFNQVGLNNILLVTHQPFVGELLEHVCGLEAGRYFLGTAHMAAIDIPVTEQHVAMVAAGMGSLRWLKQPLI
ncbi:phosphohistidine phosphatase SixA [Marinagarivorans algicola]|uniref:phosphohistidine phosphatase SixA n=1 Tax=Marinagarivorans algicola TaxID=1513270 RepID=UPI0006B89C24|nr:phosphohistidine phosphatase SixA [Marinagarivorans algicola]